MTHPQDTTSEVVARLRSASRKVRALKEWLTLKGATKTTLHRLAETSEQAADQLAALTKRVGELERCGNALSNVAFNLSQINEPLSTSQKEVMKEAVEQWDAARPLTGGEG